MTGPPENNVGEDLQSFESLRTAIKVAEILPGWAGLLFYCFLF